MKIPFILFVLICCQFTLVAQEKETSFEEDKRIEVGANVTTVLASFVGSETTEISPRNFPLTIKFAQNYKALRLGFGLGIDLKESNDPNVLESKKIGLNAALGWEWRKPIAKRWMPYFGVDIIGNYQNETSSISNPIDVVSVSQNTMGLGGGPVYGMQFAITERMRLSFEGALYGMVNYVIEKEEFEFNPQFDKEEKFFQINANLSVPQWLYFIVNF